MNKEKLKEYVDYMYTPVIVGFSPNEEVVNSYKDKYKKAIDEEDVEGLKDFYKRIEQILVFCVKKAEKAESIEDLKYLEEMRSNNADLLKFIESK